MGRCLVDSAGVIIAILQGVVSGSSSITAHVDCLSGPKGLS